MTNIIKSVRLEIAKPLDVSWDVLGQTLRDVQYAVWKTSNLAVTMAWDFQQFAANYRQRFGESLKFADLGTGNKSQTSDIYASVTTKFPDISSSVLDASIQAAEKRFKSDLPEIAKGNRSIPEFKRDIPIPIRAQQTRLGRDRNDRTVKLPLLSKKSGRPTSYTVAVRSKGSARAIFDRLLSGEYRLGDSKIQRVKTKWYVLLTYKFSAQEPTRPRDNVLGVDMGVVNAAALALYDGLDRLFIEGSEIAAFRDRIEARRRNMLRQGKYCGDGRRGHGRVTLFRPTDKLTGKIANFRNTTNHRYARAIVEFAVKHGCGTIQYEDLTGISADDAFLKRWTYYDLQTKVAQKAAEHGITVRKVDSRYTSQRCSCCGYIAERNRQSQTTFECVSCGFKANADYNAAKNIAHPRIEDLVAEELRRQQNERRNAS